MVTISCQTLVGSRSDVGSLAIENINARIICHNQIPVVGGGRTAVVDEALKRPPEEVILRGDPSKAHQLLGWEPRVNFEELVHMMVDYDLEVLGG